MIPLNERIPGHNNKLTFELIRRQHTISKIELLEQTHLSVSTLTRILEDLRDQGLIIEAGLGESTGGRRPILYQTNASYGYVYGLEISRTHSKLALFDLQMNKLESRRWAMNEGMTPAALVEEIVFAARNILAVHGIPLTSVLGMGVGAVGPLDRHSGMILDPYYFSANGWNNVPICDLLSDGLGIPVFLDNGANMAILGEYWASRDQAIEHLLYIHLGVGIRSSMMVGGKVVYGAMDMEGAIGQMIIQSDGPRLHETGNFGSLETYTSIVALEQQAESRLKQGRESILREMDYETKSPNTPNFLHLTQAYKEKDPMVVELFTQAATYFGIGLANLLNILHPEKVILGGPLISFDPTFFETAKQVAMNKTYYHPTYQVIFSQGHLGEDAQVAGASVMVVNQMTG
jgi:predicted NBD/HSP70 family sugar kinase